MADSGKAQWLKLTVVQLKGALTMRGLETEGKKADLVERLIVYEANKEKEEQAKKSGKDVSINGDEKMDTAEKKEAEKEKPDEDPYYLPRGKFIGTYRSAAALLTVLITPFNDEFFSTEVFSEHIKKTKTFKIQKIWNGTSAAELRFATVAASEEAFLALKNELASMDVDVYHPGFRTNFHKISLRNLEYDKIFEGMEDDESSYERIIILDKLPEGTTDATLAEAIPEAIEFVDIGLYEESQGCMAVAFNSKKTCQEWMEKNPELKIGDTVVRCLSYFKRERNSNSVRSKMAKEKRAQEKAEGKTEEPAQKKLSDEERLAKVKEWNSLLNSRNVLQDRDDITGYDKLAEDKRITEGMTNLARELLNDAKEKVANKEKLPEPEDQMTAPVRNLVKGETPVTATDKKTEKKTTIKETKPKDNKDTKRPFTSSVRGGARGRGTNFRSTRGGPGGRGGLGGRGGGPVGRGGANTRGGPRGVGARGSASGVMSRGGGPGGRGGGNMRGGMRGGAVRGARTFTNSSRRPLDADNRKRSMDKGPVRPLVSRGGTYYDDAPSKKRPRQMSPFRGQNVQPLAQFQSRESEQIQGLTSMLSSKMQELERMQQQTLAVQSQLNQSMLQAGRGDVGGSLGNTGVSSMMAPTQPQPHTPQSYSQLSNYHSQPLQQSRQEYTSSSYGGGSNLLGSSSNYGASSGYSTGGSASNMTNSMSSGYSSNTGGSFIGSSQSSIQPSNYGSHSSTSSNMGGGGGYSSSMSSGGRNSYGGGGANNRMGSGGQSGGPRRSSFQGSGGDRSGGDRRRSGGGGGGGHLGGRNRRR